MAQSRKNVQDVKISDKWGSENNSENVSLPRHIRFVLMEIGGGQSSMDRLHMKDIGGL